MAFVHSMTVDEASKSFKVSRFKLTSQKYTHAYSWISSISSITLQRKDKGDLRKQRIANNMPQKPCCNVPEICGLSGLVDLSCTIMVPGGLLLCKCSAKPGRKNASAYRKPTYSGVVGCLLSSGMIGATRLAQIVLCVEGSRETGLTLFNYRHKAQIPS